MLLTHFAAHTGLNAPLMQIAAFMMVLFYFHGIN